MNAEAGRRHTLCERVRWSDVDASGIIRWSAYTRFVELAETELFRAIGFPYATLWDRLDIWLPRVQFHLDCRAPARLDDELTVGIQVDKLGNSSIRFGFEMHKGDGQLAAEGHLVVVAIDRKAGNPVSVPVALATALAPYLAKA
jgi:YbgC/YbaW family acyl-CoA thioester hydrolase